MGADIVIAVDIGSDLQYLEEISSAIDVLNQLSTQLTRSGSERQIALLSESDFLIQPDMREVTTGSFDLMDRAVLYGEQAMQASLEQLKTLSVSDQEYRAYQAKKAQKAAMLTRHETMQFERIELVNDSGLANSVITSRLDLAEGERITAEQFEQDISHLYALGDFELIDYEISREQLEDEPPFSVLQLNLEQKSWGPGFVDLRLAMQGQSASKNQLTVGLAYTLKNINGLGAQWRTEAEVGTSEFYQTEFYTPLDVTQSWYWRALVNYSDRDEKYYIHQSSLQFFDLEHQLFSAKTAFGYNVNKHFAVESGLQGQVGDLVMDAYNEKLDFDAYGPYFELKYDSLDSFTFPNQGALFNGRYLYANEEWEQQERQYNANWFLRYRQAWSLSNHSVMLISELGSSQSEPISPVNVTQLGGFLRLSGFSSGEVLGNNSALLTLAYYYKLAKNDFGLFEAPVYLGASVEQGNAWDQRQDMSWNSAITAGSLFSAIDTNLGPVILAVGKNEVQSSFYLFIGHFY